MIRRRLFATALTALLVLTACGEGSLELADAPGTPSSALELDLSSVQWIHPAEGAQVKGIVAVEVRAPKLTRTVVFRIDGTELKRDTSMPWSLNFDTKKWPAGELRLRATAKDAKGKVLAESVRLVVNVCCQSAADAGTSQPDPQPEPQPEPEPQPPPAQQARPIGFGRNATGGEGGVTYWVTHLNDSGPGSLRAGAEGSGKRIVRFKVSGTIHIQTPIRPSADTTIDGAGESITVQAPIGSTVSAFLLDHDNIIVRNLHVRGGGKRAAGGEGREDGFTIHGGSNIWIDHNLITNWNDKAIGLPASANVTISWNEMYGNAHAVLMGTKATAGAQGQARTTLHHNYMHDIDDRFPRIHGNGSGMGMAHAFNNYVKNWGYGTMGPAMMTVYGAQLLAENNIFEAGPKGGNKAVCTDCGGDPGYARATGNWLIGSGVTVQENQPSTVFTAATHYPHSLEAADAMLKAKILAGVGPNN